MKDLSNNNLPLVSIIIPCRNEERYISQCLDSVVAQGYPNDKIEVFVVDGMSEDGTKEIAEGYSRKYPFIKILENPKKITPCAINIGIKKASGDYRMILGGHSELAKGFLERNIGYFKKYDADCVGGVLATLPANDSLVAQSIAVAISHPFGVGNVYARIGVKGPRFVNAVWGYYKKEVFEKIGLFDESLIKGQDVEFDNRIIKNGGKILLVPDIIAYYYARDSLLKLWRMYFQYGYCKPLLVKKIGKIFTLRQIIPPLFVGSLIITMMLSIFFKSFLWLFLFMSSAYIAANLGFSLSVSLKKGLRHFFILPLAFAILHFSYGIGYLKRVCDLIILKNAKMESRV